MRRQRPRFVGSANFCECPLSGLAYTPVAPDAEELALMRRIDELHLKHPFYGSRMLSFTCSREGRLAFRKRVQRLMRVMGIESTAPKPTTSKPHPEHVKYPYLLRGLPICRANQVWATDLTYIPMKSGFVYLVCVMDWFSRRVLSWRLSTTMDTEFCIDALREALQRYGSPDIFNTDQGAQFTSDAFTGVLKKHRVAISMDGKGRFLDNIFTSETVALREVRRGLPARVRRPERCPRWYRPLSQILQRRQTAPGAGLHDAQGLLRARRCETSDQASSMSRGATEALECPAATYALRQVTYRLRSHAVV